MELRRYGSIMWSYRKMIALLCVATTLTVIAGTYIFSPWYAATATVQIQPEARQVTTGNIPTTIDPIKMLTETESKVIISRAMAEKIVLDLGLHKKKEKRGKNLLKRGIKAARKLVVNSLVITWDILKYGRYIKPTPFEEAVAKVQKGLSAEPLRSTSLISIRVQAKDPKTASGIANVAARILVEYRRGVLEREDKIYEVRIRKLFGQREKELKEAQLTLSRYKEKEGLTSLDKQTQIKDLPQKESTLTDLIRNVKVAENSYLRLQGILDDVSIRRNSKLKQIRIVDKATPPRYFFKPLKIKYAGIGILISLIVGIGLAFLREYLNPRIRMAEDVEAFLNAPVLGVSPKVKPAKQGRR